MSIHISQFAVIVWVPSGDVPPPATPPVARTMRFGAGTTGNRWYFVAPVVDSSVELRSKDVRSMRLTGKTTAAAMQLHAYDVLDAIDVAALENGTGSQTGDIAVPDTSDVTQSARFNVNVPNAVLWTVRVAGEWDGIGEPDRLDEVVVEVATQGVKR